MCMLILVNVILHRVEIINHLIATLFIFILSPEPILVFLI